MVIPHGNRQIVGSPEDDKRTKLTSQPTGSFVQKEQKFKCRERIKIKEDLHHIKQKHPEVFFDEGTSPDFLPENYQRITRSQCIADLECITKNMKQKDRDTCMLSGTRHEEMEMAINERGKVFLDACVQPLQQFGGDLCDHNGERNHRRSYQNLNKNSESVPITYNRAHSVVSIRECKLVEKEVKMKEQNSSSYVIDSYTWNKLDDAFKIILFEAKTDEWLWRCFTITIGLEALAVLPCLSKAQVLNFTVNNGFNCLLNYRESLQQHKGNEWLCRCFTITIRLEAILQCLSIVQVLYFTGNNGFKCLLNSSESLQQHKGNVKVEQEQAKISSYADDVVIQTAHNDRKFAAATKHAILPGLKQSIPEGKVIFERPLYTGIIVISTSVPSMHGDNDAPDVGGSRRRGRPRKGFIDEDKEDVKGEGIITNNNQKEEKGFIEEDKEDVKGEGIITNNNQKEEKGCIVENKEEVKGEGVIKKGFIDEDKEDVKGERIIRNNNQKDHVKVEQKQPKISLYADDVVIKTADFKATCWLFFILILLISLGAVNTENKECTGHFPVSLQKNGSNTIICWHILGHVTPNKSERVDVAGAINEIVTLKDHVNPPFKNNVNLEKSNTWYNMTINNMTQDMFSSRYILNIGNKCQTTEILSFYNKTREPDSDGGVITIVVGVICSMIFIAIIILCVCCRKKLVEKYKEYRDIPTNEEGQEMAEV